MKSNFLICVLILLLIGVAWSSTLFHTENQEEKELLMQKGDSYLEDGYYLDALMVFEDIKKQGEDNFYLDKRIALCQYNLGQYNEFLKTTENILKVTDDADVYASIAIYYIEKNEYENAYDYLLTGIKKNPEDSKLQVLREKIKGKYITNYETYEMCMNFCDGYAIAKKNHQCILIDEQGKQYFEENTFTDIQDIEVCKNSVIVSATKDGKNYQYYDLQGYLRVSPKQNYEYLGTFHGAYALVQRDGKWGYINREFEEVQFGFDEATAYCEGIAAVQNSGKWQLIDENMQVLGKQEFQEVVVDEYHRCSVSGNVFVKYNQGYVLISADGEVISNEYQNVQAFLNKDGYAAVYDGNGWGVIDSNGKEMISCKYAKLYSSPSKMIPYMENGKWGYMDVKEDIYIKAQFDDVQALSEKGYGFIKEENWKSIELYLFEEVAYEI